MTSIRSKTGLTNVSNFVASNSTVKILETTPSIEMAYSTLTELQDTALSVVNQGTVGASNCNYYAMCWSPELGRFVACGDNSVNGKDFATSTDGINWSTVLVPYNGTANWRGVCWSSNKQMFVAAGFLTNLKKCMISYNGLNWSTVNPVGTHQWVNVTYAPSLGIFCMVGDYNTSGCVTISNDGINWTTQATPFKSLYNVCWSEELGMFVGVSYSTTQNIMISYNGSTWSTRNSNVPGNFRAICWSPKLNLFVAGADVTHATKRFAISNNGLNWSSVYSTFNNPIFNICWSNELELFIATTVGSQGFLYSKTGTSWTLYSVNILYMLGIAWSPQLKLFAMIQSSSSPTNSTYTNNNFSSYNQSITAGKNMEGTLTINSKNIDASKVTSSTLGDSIYLNSEFNGAILHQPLRYMWFFAGTGTWIGSNPYAWKFPYLYSDSTGGAITHTNASESLFTINTTGVYAINAPYTANGINFVWIDRNTTVATSVSAITAQNILVIDAHGKASAPNWEGCLSYMGVLNKGDVVRFKMTNAPNASYTTVFFTFLHEVDE